MEIVAAALEEPPEEARDLSLTADVSLPTNNSLGERHWIDSLPLMLVTAVGFECVSAQIFAQDAYLQRRVRANYTLLRPCVHVVVGGVCVRTPLLACVFSAHCVYYMAMCDTFRARMGTLRTCIA